MERAHLGLAGNNAATDDPSNILMLNSRGSHNQGSSENGSNQVRHQVATPEAFGDEASRRQQDNR